MWRTPEVSIINCEIDFILTWSEKCFLVVDTQVPTFIITDTKLHVPVVTLSTLDIARLLKQLESGFKLTIN